jgi:predicted DNA-binding protein with PD1-like motif
MQSAYLLNCFVFLFCMMPHSSPSQTMNSTQATVRLVESATKALTLRLSPGMDVKEELERIVKERNIKAASVLTCVGSLSDAVIRFANKPTGTGLRGPMEIVSLTGTLGSESGSHLHIAVSDGEGKTLGGHVLKGCIVFTTAEIVLAILPDAVFTREQDSASGYKELVVSPLLRK